MDIIKLKNEKKLITFFIVVASIVFIFSSIFIYKSIKVKELGGSFISAMLLFISGYGLIVFSNKLIKYKRVIVIQKAVLEDGILDINLLSETFERSDEKIEKDLTYLIDNGYLSGYELVGDYLINLEEERIRKDKMRQAYLKQKEIENQKSEPKRRRRSIESNKCPNCGATVQFDGEGKATCMYCGNSLKKA